MEEILIFELFSSGSVFDRAKETILRCSQHTSCTRLRRRTARGISGLVLLSLSVRKIRNLLLSWVSKTETWQEWCSEVGLNLRSLVMATKIRKQLAELAKKEDLKLESCGAEREPLRLKIGSEGYGNCEYRKALALGLFMNACEFDREKDAYRMLLSPSTIVSLIFLTVSLLKSAGFSRYLGDPSQSQVKIHPSSVVAHSRPSCIVFSKLLRTTDLYAM